MHIGTPQRNIKKHNPTVNKRRCFNRYWGQLSTKPVTRASTLQNSESTPSTCKVETRAILIRLTFECYLIRLIKSSWFNWILNTLTKSIVKNIIAQITDPGKFRTKSGYVTKTSPGPEATTLSMSVSWTCAIYPRIEKTNTPAIKQVRVFTMQVIMASLQNKKMKQL